MSLMKEWQVTLGGALVMFIAGIGMFLWANSLEIPATFLGYNEYILVSNQYFSTSQAGALFTGFGGGLLICTLLIYQLEKKLESKQKRHI
ncbi:hypothetical protein GH146_02585 [archaeon]|nr:hypothetical protein [archaeon]